MRSLICLLLLLLAVPAFALEGTPTLHTGDWVWLTGLLIVPVARWAAKFTKTDMDDKAVGWLSKGVHLLGLKFKRVGLK